MITRIACTIFLFGMLASCSDSITPFLVDQQEHQAELRKLIESARDDDSPETRFITNQRIIALYKESDALQEELLYLTSYVETFPDDQFDAYYLLLAAEHYRKTGAIPFAAYYYERIIKNHPDLLLDGKRSVHKTCLVQLIQFENEPEIRAGYYKELISRFSNEIDRGRLAYELATTYQELGEWDLAMQLFKEYLNYPETTIPGRLNAREEIIQLVTLYDMPNKNWTYEKLEDLIANIQRAIWSQNPRYLNSLRARVGFFAKAWEGDELVSSKPLLSDLSVYLKSHIRIPGNLDRDSNQQEAYLPTYGWGFRIPTWYLYFKRLDFPADPSIHGQWEWAGIYLGEKPY